MALDNANFIAELSITDPPGSDPLSQGDDQIRTIKRATFNSLPLLDKAVNITADQMNLMAIKNEANVFTADQTIQDADVIVDAVQDFSLSYRWHRAGIVHWAIGRLGDASGSHLRLTRFDVLGAPVDNPWQADFATGVVDFAHVPTVLGAPLWIAGEVRQFVTGAAVPGANWFYADGTNGTIDLRNRILMGDQTAVAGTLQLPNLVATAAAGVTGSTAISSAQMPVHTHRALDRGSGSGISDATSLTQSTGLSGNRNTACGVFVTQGTCGQFLENTGSGAGHTHTSPAQAVTENGTNRDTVRPYSAVVRFFQYVP